MDDHLIFTIMYFGSNMFLDCGKILLNNENIFGIILQCFLNTKNASSERLFLLFFPNSDKNLHFGVLTYTPQASYHFQGIPFIWPIQQPDTSEKSLMGSGALSHNPTKNFDCIEKNCRLDDSLVELFLFSFNCKSRGMKAFHH